MSEMNGRGVGGVGDGWFRRWRSKRLVESGVNPEVNLRVIEMTPMILDGGYDGGGTLVQTSQESMDLIDARESKGGEELRITESGASSFPEQIAVERVNVEWVARILELNL